MLTDAHAHLSAFPEEPAARQGIRTMLCGTDPATAARAFALRGESTAVCCGLHPWNAGRYTVEDMLPFIRRSDALGEIGMDSVWTDTDLSLQREVFVRQLDIAARWDMPVVLHTKGMEAEIAAILRKYDLRKLVHWYSCGEHLRDYIDQGCYFSVGPDHGTNPAVQQVIRQVPSDRLLTETDGLEGIAWALGRSAVPGDIGDVLRGELSAIARIRGIGADRAMALVEENYTRFLGKG